ncbi:gfo/Idh/MocA family oxidoreductase [Salibacterium salarium]|uniref:Gfo/Idh/MocA family oxidoreductase n=1 Tax=Salibacterium salarium TaxID=284579 RepID=A0A3R9QUD6_9BACI|nr:gfo/Idh/MocA family oxidoreductase [Salibacterium salarium]
MHRIKWGILGPGNIAEKFAKAIIEENGSIYAVGSRNLDRAQTFAANHNIEKAYGCYADLMKDQDVDVIYISTPHSHHYKYIMECLHQGKHVLCEKAITINGDQLRDIARLAEQKDLVVAEAMTIYHMPLLHKLRNIITSGQIGSLKLIQVSFGSAKEDDDSNRFFHKELAGGALFDIGSYALSFSRFFLSSSPDDIQTTVKKFRTDVDEQSGIILKNQDDEMAVISLAFRAKMPKRGIISGENGFITVENFPRATTATIQYLDGQTEVVEAGTTSKGLVYEVEAMNHYISNGFQAETLPLSMDVLNIMDEVRKQWGIHYPFPYEE